MRSGFFWPLLLAQIAIATVGVRAQDNPSSVEQWDKKYAQLLEEHPEIRQKVQRGDAAKAEVIAWMKDTEFEKNSAEKKSGEKRHNFPDTAFEYAKLVESQLGVPPKVDLGEAVEIPIYVDGKQAYGNLGKSCDNPTLLGKETISGSVLQRYEGRTAEGEPLPDVVWVAFGRNSSDDHRRTFGSVQMIGYHQKTGATAFFESSDKIHPWVTLDEKTLRMRGEMPWIDEPEQFNRAFTPPGNTQCVQCHQNEPFITDSFIKAAKIPGTNEPVIPILDQDAPYYVIGGETWDMRTVHIEGNACFDCHRVGMATMELFMSNGWDANQHMPPHDPGSLKEELRQLLDAWERGPENVPGAKWITPPARGMNRKVVGDDYPFKALFNKPKREKQRFDKK